MSASSPRGLYALVFTVGMASLGAEIAAARLLAPYFGASTIIWANTIGIVLVALSLGYWLGGRLADRHPHEHGLRLVLLVAAAMVAAIPLISGPFLEVSIDAFDSLDAGAFIGSLLGVLVLVAVPVLLLGAASPWAIRLAVHTIEEAGTVAGRMYAVSTAGSLIGTFLSALLLVPFIGTQRTFMAFAAAVAIVAAWGMPRRFLAAPAALLALLAVPPGATKPDADGGERVIFETETPYQYARVVEEGTQRTLELNEGQAIHSLYDSTTVFTRDYWDLYLVMPYATLDRDPRRIAILGNAAGTIARGYEELHPGTEIDGVEIDPEVSEIGRRYFEMDNPRLTVHDDDARPFLRRSPGGYDLISIDAYRQPYIPFYLATREFFELARDRLGPGGTVIVNVGHPEGSERLEKVLAATMRAALPNVVRYPASETNTLLIGSRSRISGADMQARVARARPRLRELAEDVASRLGPALSGGDVYTDDRAPVEWLIDSSIVEYAAGG